MSPRTFLLWYRLTHSQKQQTLWTSFAPFCGESWKHVFFAKQYHWARKLSLGKNISFGHCRGQNVFLDYRFWKKNYHKYNIGKIQIENWCCWRCECEHCFVKTLNFFQLFVYLYEQFFFWFLSRRNQCNNKKQYWAATNLQLSESRSKEHLDFWRPLQLKNLKLLEASSFVFCVTLELLLSSKCCRCQVFW